MRDFLATDPSQLPVEFRQLHHFITEVQKLDYAQEPPYGELRSFIENLMEPIDVECVKISKEAVRVLAAKHIEKVCRMRVSSTIVMVDYTRDLMPKVFDNVRHALVKDILTKVITQMKAQTDELYHQLHQKVVENMIEDKKKTVLEALLEKIALKMN